MMEEAGCVNMVVPGRGLALGGHVGSQLPMAAALSGEAGRDGQAGVQTTERWA